MNFKGFCCQFSFGVVKIYNVIENYSAMVRTIDFSNVWHQVSSRVVLLQPSIDQDPPPNGKEKSLETQWMADVANGCRDFWPFWVYSLPFDSFDGIWHLATTGLLADFCSYCWDDLNEEDMDWSTVRKRDWYWCCHLEASCFFFSVVVGWEDTKVTRVLSFSLKHCSYPIEP